jgi:ABC-type multidrug transport system ATPase subunit
MLQVEGLVVRYGGRSRNSPVLNEVGMVLDGGKMVIVGPNGSGKSTLIKAILGLVPIQSGGVTVFGKDRGSESNDVRVSTNLAEG